MRHLAHVVIPVVMLGAVLSCATGHTPKTGNTIALPTVQVPVPSHPDSAWAVAAAIRIFADADNPRFDVVSFCSERNGFLVDLTPAGPPRTLGGGGLVFISLTGTAVVLVPDQ